MSIYEKLWLSDISDETISSEVVAAKEISVELGVNPSDIIHMRTALELDRLRETLTNICAFSHRNSHLTDIARLLQEIAGK